MSCAGFTHFFLPCVDYYTNWQTPFPMGRLTSAKVRTSQFRLLQHQQSASTCSFWCWTVAARGLKFLIFVTSPFSDIQSTWPLKYLCGPSPLFQMMCCSPPEKKILDFCFHSASSVLREIFVIR